jgi:hypothetical protein
MKRTSGLIVMALAMSFLYKLSPARALQAAAPTTIQAAHSKTSIVPAEESGGDDSGDDGADSGDAE